MYAKMRKTDNQAKIDALKALQSPVTIQVLEEMIAEYVFNTGASIEEIEFDPVVSDWTPGKLTCNVWVSDPDCYDWLMNQNTTGINDKIRSTVHKTMYFLSHGNTYAEITFHVSCELPEDDFKTLDMLGKVHREFKPGKMEQSIYCEI